MSSWFSRLFTSRRYSGHYNEGNEGSSSTSPSEPATTTTTTTTAAAAATAAEEGANLEYMPLPKERITTIKGVFGFSSWQGVPLMESFFVLFYSMLGVLMFLNVANAVIMGSAGLAILYLVLAPIFFLLLTMAARVFTEVVISVLM
eukprot:evm.model.NODE_3200_length_18072_cov_20.463037.7